MHMQGATHGAGRECAAMQAKAMTIFAGGKAVRENAGKILRRNTYAIVGYHDADGAFARGYD